MAAVGSGRDIKLENNFGIFRIYNCWFYDFKASHFPNSNVRDPKVVFVIVSVTVKKMAAISIACLLIRQPHDCLPPFVLSYIDVFRSSLTVTSSTCCSLKSSSSSSTPDQTPTKSAPFGNSTMVYEGAMDISGLSSSSSPTALSLDRIMAGLVSVAVAIRQLCHHF